MTAEPVTGPKVSIILVNYNTTSLLLECLKSIEDQFDACSYEVIVVDNATKGFAPGDVTTLHPKVKVLLNDHNVGFGQASNLGAAVASGAYFWLLNTDTLVPANNNLGVVVKFLDRNPRHAAASPILVDSRGEAQTIQRAYFPSITRLIAEKPARWLVRALPAARQWLGWLDFNFKPIEDGDVPVLVAASLFVRKSHFDEAGGFSPNYFMFLEDSDLCRTFAQLGYSVRFLPQARVVHFLGGSIQSHYDRKRMYLESQEAYFKRWSTPLALIVVKAYKWPVLCVHRWTERRRAGPGVANGR